MKTKYYLIFLAMLLSFGFSNELSAQRCLVFRYDAVGNRISRSVTTNCQETREIVEEQEESLSVGEIEVYPNPNNGRFKVLIPDSIKTSNSSFKLYDVEGQIVMEGRLVDYETDIDIGNKPTGVFLLKIINGDIVNTKIVLKQ